MIWWVLSVILVLFIQSRFIILGIKPELSIVIVFIYGMRTRDENRSTLFGFITGIIEDSLSGVWGPNILSKTITGFVSANIIGGYFVWSPILGIIGLFFVTIVESFINILVLSLKAEIISSSIWIAYTILIQAIINAPLGYLAGKEE